MSFNSWRRKVGHDPHDPHVHPVPTATAATDNRSDLGNAHPPASMPSNDSVAPSVSSAAPQQPPPHHRTLHVPAPLQRHSSSYSQFSEIPSLPAFLSNCKLSQYLESFNNAGANDDAMPLIIEFDEDELDRIMDAIPMKPFHAVTFRKGVRDLREKSRMGSMHFDNPQSSFLQSEPVSKLHYSHSQFFQAHPSTSSQLPPTPAPPRQGSYQQGPPSLMNGGTLHRQSSSSANALLQPRLSHLHSSFTPSQRHDSLLSSHAPLTQGRSLHPPNVPRTPTFGYSRQPSQTNTTSGINGIPWQAADPSRHSLSDDPSAEPPRESITASHSASSAHTWTDSVENSPEKSPPPQPDSFAQTVDRDSILYQALIYGKSSSRTLTSYEDAINRAAQSLALQDTSLLANKHALLTKAKAKLLEEGYNYKRGASRSKLPEAAQRKERRVSKEQIIQKREVNASNAATVRLGRIASLDERLHRKTAEREDIKARLLQLDGLDSRCILDEGAQKAEIARLHEELKTIEAERSSLSKDLGSLKSKERKHQWYENRKRNRAEQNANGGATAETGTDADEEGGGTDSTTEGQGQGSEESHRSKRRSIETGPPILPTSPRPKPVPEKASRAVAKPKAARDIFRVVDVSTLRSREKDTAMVTPTRLA